jgi:membrane associated rhomboid family serine protease
MAVYSIQRKKSFFERLSLTSILIIINILVFVLAYIIIFTNGEEFLIDNFALTPLDVLSGNNVWTVITTMFLHITLFHLFANMFSLFFIGGFLEKIIGRIRFFWVYIISGIFGSIFFILDGLIFNNNIPGVGASGAIFGLLGVLAVLVPYSTIYLIAGPIILIVLRVVIEPFVSTTILPTIDIIFNILIVLMIFSMLSFSSSFRKLSVPVELPMWLLPIVAIVPLVAIDLVPGIDLPISNSAHFGGLVAGLVYGFYLRKKYPNKTRHISKMFR